MKTALITGSSSGFGKATAQLFLNNGWNVVATMRQPQDGLFNASSNNLRVIALDVTDAESVRVAVSEALGAFGGNPPNIMFKATPEQFEKWFADTACAQLLGG